MPKSFQMAKKYEVWIADLDPRFGSEAGKKRPVIVVQNDLLNGKLNSTMICPITTNVISGVSILRIHLPKGTAGLNQDCDILVSQVRAIDNRRFIQRLGQLPANLCVSLDDNLKIVLDLS